MLKKQLRLVLFVALASWFTAAKANPQIVQNQHLPSFAAAVVRLDSNDQAFPQVWDDPTTATFKITGMTVEQLIAYAFDLEDPSLISGLPRWAKAEKYDLYAKVSQDDSETYSHLSKQKRKQMLQSLLLERFSIASHDEPHRINTYSLIASSKGIKIKPLAKPADDSATSEGATFGEGPRLMRYQEVTMSRFAQSLTGIVGRRVTDESGLTGRFSFKLGWNGVEGNDPDAAANGSKDASGSPYPPLVVALREQLGLELRSQHTTQFAMAVDRISRPSSDQ